MFVEVDVGDYVVDVVVWLQYELMLCVVGGCVRFVVVGVQVQGKGLFVMSGWCQCIEGFDFVGVVVFDCNGVGICLEVGLLMFVDCSFCDNENGLLMVNDDGIEFDIVDCDFGFILLCEGKMYNFYVGVIWCLVVIGSYFYYGLYGYLFKSCVVFNYIFYNCFSDEIGGCVSYELEFFNGGVVVVMGNFIMQSLMIENFYVIVFGVEGVIWLKQRFYFVNNMLVDQMFSGGIWLCVVLLSIDVVLVNNFFVGMLQIVIEGYWICLVNFSVDWDEFVCVVCDDYWLWFDFVLCGKVQDVGEGGGLWLVFMCEYCYLCGSVVFGVLVCSLGVFQF